MHEAIIFYKCLAALLSAKWGMIIQWFWIGFDVA